MRIAIVGGMGRMGRAVIEEARREGSFEIRGIIEVPSSPHLGRHLDSLLGALYPHAAIADGWTAHLEGTEALIDFSSPRGTAKALELALEHGLPLVSGTTGLPEALVGDLVAASARIPVFFAPNMSTGMHLLRRALRAAAAILPRDWDVQVIDIHHKTKKDSPSGTALELSKLITGARKGREREGTGPVGIHSLRMGQVPGVHSIMLAGAGELLELTHTVQSRAAFAQGALAAARFVRGRKPGYYGMDDLCGSGGTTRG